MCVYIVRYEERVDGEVKCGNFELGFVDEKAAEKTMLADFKYTLYVWNVLYGGGVESGKGEKNGNGCHDYCYIKCNKCENHYKWWIDKIEIATE